MGFWEQVTGGGSTGAGTSIDRYIRQLEALQVQFADCLGAYRAAVKCVADSAPSIGKVRREKFIQSLRGVADSLKQSPDRKALEELRKRFEFEVGQYARDTDRHLADQEREAKEVMAAVAVMAESMASREKDYNVRFRGVAKKLRLLTTTQDLATIRKKLSEEVAMLEHYVEDMARDTTQALTRVQGDLLQARRAPREEANWKGAAESLSLPGLAKAQAEFANKTRSTPWLAVAVARICEFEALEQRHGGACMLALSASFAERLAKQLGPDSTVYAAAAGVLFWFPEGNLAQALDGCGRLEGALSGPAKLEVSGKNVELGVKCAVGVAQYLPGETLEQVIERAHLTCVGPQKAGR